MRKLFSYNLSIIVIFQFLFCINLLQAKSNIIEKTGYSELLELKYDELEAEKWLSFTEFPPEVSPIPYVAIETRHNWIPRSNLVTNRLSMVTSPVRYSGVPALYANIYQKLKEGDKPLNLGKFSAVFVNRKLIKRIAIGNFRLQAGQGLCLGSYRNANDNQTRRIYPSTGFSHPAFTGAALRLNASGFDVYGWMSGTQRLALLDGNKISRLYESELTVLDNKDKVSENTGGIIAEYHNTKRIFGAYVYLQDYSRAFVDSSYSPVEYAWGFYTFFDRYPVTYGWETSFVGKNNATAAFIGIVRDNFATDLSYICRPVTSSLPYAKTEQLFGQKTGTEEISWDARYYYKDVWYFTNRIAIVRDSNPEASSLWKERQILSLETHEKNHKAGITYYRFSKYAVPVYDTLSTEILPTQHRLKGFWKQYFVKKFSLGITAQYQHYLNQTWTQNGFSMQYTASYLIWDTALNLSFTTWVNHKTTFQSDDVPTEEEMMVLADSDSAFRLSASRDIAKGVRLKLNAFRPLRHVSRQSFGLNLQAQI